MLQQIMLKMTLGMTKSCFGECVNSFKEDKLTTNEQNCIKKCASRSSQSLQSMNEIQSNMLSKGGAGAGGLGF
jgi:hypothetical protein